MLDPIQSRGRQKRLLDQMAKSQLDAVVVGWPGHVYYFSAFLTGWLHQSAFVLFADGRSWMVTANSAASGAAADQVVAYEAQWNATLRSEQPAEVAKLVADQLQTKRARRVGIDASLVTSQLPLTYDAKFESIDPVLWQMRRAKEPDELSLMKQAIRCSAAMYERARQIIEPGIPELRVFGELHAAAVDTAGEPLSALLGNDFQCGSIGGPPRNGRGAIAGELYILDLGPCYRGYFADNARTISVDRRPTDEQMQAWHTLMHVFKIVEGMAKPAVRCRDLYEGANSHLSLKRSVGMPHHLGHGVGLQPHEYPHLNPRWDDVLIEGEVFTVEPGVYGPELGGGIRVENQYVVTGDGVRNLTEFSLELV
jgi:Xaa-Pro aminopeptidase